MKKSRKAQVGFHLMVFVFFMIILVMLLYAFSEKTNSMNWKIGDRSADLFKVYQEQEKNLQLVDYKNNYAAQKALYDLTRYGVKNTSCGSYLGYNYWNNPEKDCYPFYPIQLSKMFGQVFPENNNYNLILKDKGKKTEVIGIAAENIQVNASSTYKNVSYSWDYSVKPSFNIQLNHDISYYRELIKYIKGTETVRGLMLSAAICSKTGTLDECIKEKVNEINQKPEMKDNGWELKFGSENCDNEYEQAYDKIAGTYLECLNSPDDDCRCSIPDADLDGFKIRFLQQGPDTIIRLDSDETINKEPLVLSKIPNTNLCMIESQSDVDFKDVPHRNIQNIEEIPKSLYKKDRLCFVGNLEGKAEEQYQEKKECKIQPKSFKFCLDTKQKVFAQDKTDDKKGFVPVILRFALLFEDQT